MQSTSELLEQHLEAFTERDLDKMMDTYSQDAVMINEEDEYIGKEQIRSEFERLFDVFSESDLTESGRILSKVVDDYAYIVWSAETPEWLFPHVSATFVIKSGRIIFQTMSGESTSKEELLSLR